MVPLSLLYNSIRAEKDSDVVKSGNGLKESQYSVKGVYCKSLCLIGSRTKIILPSVLYNS